MKRYAANRVCNVLSKDTLRNQVVELDENSHQVIRIFRLEGEIRQTEWLGGVILLANECPSRMQGEKFATFMKRISLMQSASTKLHAYHITAFDVSSMEFTTGSRIIYL